MATPQHNEDHVLLFTSKALYVSLHSLPPGDTGASEITAIPREQLAWTTGGIDGKAVADPVTFDMPAGTEVSHLGFWTASLGGTFIDSLSCLLSYPSAGTYTVTLNYTHT